MTSDAGHEVAVELIEVEKTYRPTIGSPWHLPKSKRNQKSILKGRSFSIPQGAVTAYVGANGSGKSTTLKIIAGVMQPYAGTVKFFGQKAVKKIKNIKTDDPCHRRPNQNVLRSSSNRFVQTA